MRRGDPPPAGAVLRAAWLTGLALGIGAAAVAAEPAEVTFPLPLEDPLAGVRLQVKPGPPALHLVFFATWCPPCLEELPQLAEWEARWSGRGYRLLLIAVPTRHTPSRLMQFDEMRQPPGELLFDPAGTAKAACGVGDIPAHLLIDRAGRVVYRSTQLDDGLEAALEALLGRGRGGGRGR